jgi:hypothetical protein
LNAAPELNDVVEIVQTIEENGKNDTIGEYKK